VHFFIMDMDNLTKPQVKLSLIVGATKKLVKLTPHATSRRYAYDFLAVADCLTSSYFRNAYVGITDFSNPVFFKMNYASNVLFHMSVPSVDFLDDRQKSLIFEMNKLRAYVSIRPATRLQEIADLKYELTDSLQQYF
jgi:hypothetical protein